MTAALAVCFMTLGAYIMYGSGQSFSDQSSTQFTHAVIRLYTASLGDWSYLIIASSAFSVMFGTTLVIFDGYARAMDRTWTLLFSRRTATPDSRIVYKVWLLIGAVGGYLIIAQFLSSFTTLVDLATVISFLIAPVIAVANQPAGPEPACAGRRPTAGLATLPKLGRASSFCPPLPQCTSSCGWRGRGLPRLARHSGHVA